MDAIDLLLIASKSESKLVSESRIDESAAAEHLGNYHQILLISVTLYFVKMLSMRFWLFHSQGAL